MAAPATALLDDESDVERLPQDVSDVSSPADGSALSSDEYMPAT